MEPLRVLVVCTANVCRSPVAHRLLQRKLDDAGVPAVVTSAGTDAGPYRVHRHTKAAAEKVGVSLIDHEPRRLTPELGAADGKDLIITMTREHLYKVVVEENDAFARTFTLPELADRVMRVSDAGMIEPSAGFDAWLGALNVGRSPNDLMPGSPDDDVVDPYGQPRREHDAMVAEVGDLLTPIVVSLVTAMGSALPAPGSALTAAPAVSGSSLPRPAPPEAAGSVSDEEARLAQRLVSRLNRRRGSTLSINSSDAAPVQPKRKSVGTITLASSNADAAGSSADTPEASDAAEQAPTARPPLPPPTT